MNVFMSGWGRALEIRVRKFCHEGHPRDGALLFSISYCQANVYK